MNPALRGHHHLPLYSVDLPPYLFKGIAMKGLAMTRSLLPLLALLALTACETVKGAGRDLQIGGSAITSEANKVQTNP